MREGKKRRKSRDEYVFLKKNAISTSSRKEQKEKSCLMIRYSRIPQVKQKENKKGFNKSSSPQVKNKKKKKNNKANYRKCNKK